jgi:hypothetical protein
VLFVKRVLLVVEEKSPHVAHLIEGAEIFIDVVRVVQCVAYRMQDAVFHERVLAGIRDAGERLTGDREMLLVEHVDTLVRVGVDRMVVACDMNFRKSAFHGGVALRRGAGCHEGVGVEGPVQGRPDGVDLVACQQVGIAHRGFLMTAESLGGLEYSCKVAQVGLRLNLLPECLVRYHGVGGVVVVVPVVGARCQGCRGGDGEQQALAQTRGTQPSAAVIIEIEYFHRCLF